jgi:hypothetical protein
MRIFIATCDSLSYILRPYAWLMDKYCLGWNDIQVLGYSVFPQLPERFHCVSLAPEQIGLNSWTRNLYNYFVSIDDEFVIFGLEDFLPVCPFDMDVLMTAFAIMVKDPNIGRYELGTGHCWHKETTDIYTGKNFTVYEYGFDSLYRISTQNSIWRRRYLLQYLNFDRTPWEFEVEGSREAQHDGVEVIATHGRSAWRWDFSALSGKYPDKVNIEGINRDDIEQMIGLGLLQRDKLQVGIELNSPLYV